MRTLNTVDRFYFGWFLALSMAIVMRRSELPAWTAYLCVHGAMLIIIGLLAWGAAPHVSAENRRANVGHRVVPENPRANVGHRHGHRAVNFLHAWYPLAAFIVCFEEVSRLSLLFVPHWQDAHLLALEARFFAVPPTVWFHQHASFWLTEVLEVGYFSYFLLLMIVGGALYGEHERETGNRRTAFSQLMLASVVAYMGCYVVFLLFPTEGPAHTLAARPAGAGGPFHWAVLLIQKYAGVHGNAFPSSHVAAGVVALWFAWRYRPKLGAALTPLVVLLGAGAVYDGYHYLSDVVAGAAVGVVVAATVIAIHVNLFTTEDAEDTEEQLAKRNHGNTEPQADQSLNYQISQSPD